MDNKPDCISRRDFIKIIGAGTAGAAIAAGMGGCDSQKKLPLFEEGPSGQMTYRTDPRSGNKMSLLGFGMMRLPLIQRRRGESLPDVNDIDQEAVNELVDYAIEHGVNVFHTAPMYGKGFSETATGEALSRHPRDKYYVATCLSSQRGPRTMEHAVSMYNNSFEYLKTDYIDYYFLHNLGSFEAFKSRFLDNGVLDFLFKEKEAGRIRNLGWSFHGEGDFFEWMAKEYPWDFTMINLNYLNWSRGDWRAGGGVTDVIAQWMYEVLAEKNIPVWIMGPLMGGILARVHHKARELMMQYDQNASPASWGLRFAASLPNVVTVLSGMTFMDHLKENISTYSPLVPLREEEKNILVEQISQIAHQYRNINCTRCQYCTPCPYGIDIPGIFTHYNRCMNEGNYPEDRQSEDYRRARRAFLIGMDRSVPALRQANRCINCRLCVPNCPQRINIPQEMRRIDKFIEVLRQET